LPDISLLALFETAGVAVFALTGALLAARRRLDPFGFAMLATLTGIGGGTLRDLLLDRPVFWVAAPRDLYICVGLSLLVFAIGRIRPALLDRMERADLLHYADAAGLALFAVIGSLIARESGAPLFVSLALGAMTASFGGILRDVIVGEPSLVVRSEIYVTAAALAAGVALAGLEAGLYRDIAMGLGFIAGFGLRLAALRLGWSLPTSPRG
jgi:uncharacterized membrane protein YeiH